MGWQAAAIIGAIGFALVACGGSSGPSNEPGVPGFRAFAAQFQSALDKRDTHFLDERIKLTTGVCTTADIAGGIGAAPCSTVGAPWSGFLSGVWHSEGGYVPFDGAAFLREFYDKALLAASDAFGDGGPRIYALSISDTKPATIITELQMRPSDFAGSGPLRVVYVLGWTSAQAGWKAQQLLSAAVLGEEFLLPCQDALDYLGGTWERFPDASARGPSTNQCTGLGSGTPAS